jgi:galactofuranose transport system ATP-binding protein
MSDEKPILQMTGMYKSFPGVKALSGVDFRLFKGEVHAIMGQNGAGKSTLIKVLTGVYQHDKGTIVFEGNQCRFKTPLDAQKCGISTVYQEVNLCPNLSVAENIFIGREPRRFGMIDWKTINKRSEELLKRLNISIDVTQLLSSFSVAIQQMVAIARVLNTSSSVLILDEPTSSLDENEVNELFSVLTKLKEEGLAILFVTHFLEQTYRIADRITVLRNGTLVGEFLTCDLPRVDLIVKMIGKDLSALSGTAADESCEHEPETASADQFCTIKGMGKQGSINSFDLEIRNGEVLGFAGLLGSGRTETARLIFGIDKTDSGDLRIRSVSQNIKSPRDAINLGMGFCPEDRKTEGIIDELSVRENIILALQGTMGIMNFLSRKKQEKIADTYIKALGIKTPSAESAVRTLSGGNQQKVMLARWLATEPKLLILDEPTRGIDVGAKFEVQKFVMDHCKKGMSIIFISSELEEVIRVSNRVAVFRDRNKIKELNGENINEETVMQTIAGGQIS